VSRVVYSETADTLDQEKLRAAHGVRLVRDAEEGTGVNALPGGVYGYTYSPGLPSAPLFAVRRYRSYEIHKIANGETFVVGFVSPGAASQVQSTSTDVTVSVHPEPRPEHETLIQVPYSRMHHHRQYAAPNQDGFTVMLAPARSPQDASGR
jgi:hypothetical protein